MPIVDELLKGGISGLLSGAGDFATKIRTAITGKAVLTADQLADLEKLTLQHEAELGKQKAELDLALVQFDAKVNEQQTRLNEIEAQSPSLFKSGWRPSVGWICVAGLAYCFLLQPLFPWLIGFFRQQVPALPSLDTGVLMTLLLGMLGLGGLRTWEKRSGLAK